MAETTDLLVVGGGVFGLWAARRAAAAGLSATLVEARRIGAGASGGVLGALTAHTPDRWSEKKAFQLDALAELAGEIARLEAETGLATGYRRSGRVMPIRTAAFAAQIPERETGARARWAPLDPAFVYQARAPGAAAGWLAEEAAPLGVLWDGLAAVIRPRAYLAALRRSLEGRAEIREGARFLGWDGAAARLSDGARIAAGRVLLAAGFETAGLHPALARAAAPGGGVKGRAALFRLAGVAGRPLIYEDGVYVAPHGDGTVAVGSTDEKDWAAPGEDPFLAGARPEGPLDFIDRAKALCPPLRGLEPIEIWGGVRPKMRSRDPLLGPLDQTGRLWALGGGFKIGLGIAHRLAAAALDRLVGAPEPTPVPATFLTEAARP